MGNILNVRKESMVGKSSVNDKWFKSLLERVELLGTSARFTNLLSS